MAKRCAGIKIKLKPHCLLFRDFTFWCVQLSKNMKYFLKKNFLVLILQSTCFICITWKRKQTMEQKPHRACEWTKSNKNKKKLRHVIFKATMRSIVRFSPQNNAVVSLKDGFTSLTSVSKGRFLASNILLAWCLVMAQIQFSLTKKIKIGRPEHSLTLQPTTSDNISFLLYPPALPLPPQSGCSYVHP